MANRRARRFVAWLPGMLLATAAILQPWLEASMARHMGLGLPLLFAIGWLAARAAGPRLTHALEPWNARGVTALVATMAVTAFWMLPAALDLAVLHIGVALAKVATWVLAGLLTSASWKRAGTVIQAFFLLNWCWMTLAVGLIYREAPQQLCSVYLADEQAAAGAAMMCWALAILGLWVPRAFVAGGIWGDGDEAWPPNEPPRHTVIPRGARR